MKDKVAAWIAGGILKVQKRFANFFESRSMSWGTKQKWLFFYFVCLLFGGFSLMVVVRSFSKKTSVALSRPGVIKAPAPLPEEPHLIQITDKEIMQVEAFIKSLDSTKRKKLKLERPGLMDSLERVKELYYSQIK